MASRKSVVLGENTSPYALKSKGPKNEINRTIKNIRNQTASICMEASRTHVLINDKIKKRFESYEPPHEKNGVLKQFFSRKLET